MPTYIYEAQNDEGIIVRGLIESRSRSVALSELKTYHFRIRNIHEQTRFDSFLNQLFRVNQLSLAIFTRELSTMFKSGIPLLRCLDVLSHRGENRRLEDVALLLREHIKAGDSFFQAISRYPEVFDPVYQSLVQAGEVSGHLGEILERLALFLEKDMKLRRTAKAAMSYPIVVFVFCVLISLGLIVFIFPQFIDLFEGLDVAMPWPTRLMIGLVNTIRNPFVVMLLAGLFGLSLAFLNRYVQSPVGKRQYHQFLLTMPVMGSIRRKIAISRFCRTFATLFASGVPILRSLEVVSEVSGNVLIDEAVLRVRESVRYGSSISAPLEESALFPPMVTGMIQIGEQSGYLHKMLAKVADYYEMEVEVALLSLAKLLEPFLICVMGVIVGFVLIAIFLPIYSLIGSFSK